MVAQVTARIALTAALAALLPAAGVAQDRPPAGNEAAAKLKPIVERRRRPRRPTRCRSAN
jgi:hypothetical protein